MNQGSQRGTISGLNEAANEIQMKGNAPKEPCSLHLQRNCKQLAAVVLVVVGSSVLKLASMPMTYVDPIKKWVGHPMCDPAHSDTHTPDVRIYLSVES